MIELPEERSLPRQDCPEPWRWHARDLQATEVEVSELLRGLCIGIRPHRVLETGSYEGDTTVALGQALVGYGVLDTVERDPERAERVRIRTLSLPVVVHNVSSLEFDGGDYDLMFFDSDPEIRPLEMRRFARAGAVWALHDSWWPEIQTQLRALLDEGVIEPWIDLPTPRGLALGRFPAR